MATDAEINEAVARKLGRTSCGCFVFHLPMEECDSKPHVPHYCHSIDAAWEICEKIKNEVLLTIWWHDGEWECDIEMSEGEFKANADTAPRAICLAFLKLIDNI